MTPERSLSERLPPSWRQSVAATVLLCPRGLGARSCARAGSHLCLGLAGPALAHERPPAPASGSPSDPPEAGGLGRPPSSPLFSQQERRGRHCLWCLWAFSNGIKGGFSKDHLPFMLLLLATYVRSLTLNGQLDLPVCVPLTREKLHERKVWGDCPPQCSQTQNTPTDALACVACWLNCLECESRPLSV